MSAQVDVAARGPFTATLIVENPQPLEFGGRLDRCAIGFRQYGDPALPLVIVLGGISAGRNIVGSIEGATRGWWNGFVGEGLAIDTTRYSVLGIDWLGGSGASTGPVPSIGTRDQARAIIAVLDHLAVDCAQAVVGASYGGMVALALGTDHPERVERSVVISAAHRPHPMATALRSLQRGVVRLGMETGRVNEALRLARGIAMTTYRTVEEFRGRFDADARWSPEGARFAVEEYLDEHGRRFARTFSPESFLCLSESIDLHWVEPSAVRTPTTLIAVSSDTLVPTWQMEELRAGLCVETGWHVVESVYGHDAFLKEVDAMSAIIGAALG
jgi:homoserine O-acetyltransferase